MNSRCCWSACPLEKARQIADDVVRSVSDYRFVWKDKIFNIGVSIGIVEIGGGGGGVIEDLMNSADSACYVRQETGAACTSMCIPRAKKRAPGTAARFTGCKSCKAPARQQVRTGISSPSCTRSSAACAGRRSKYSFAWRARTANPAPRRPNSSGPPSATG